MRLSTRAHYGIQGLCDIACHGKERLVQLREIAGRHGMNARYLHHVLCTLKKAHLIGSKMGPTGGYFLLRAPGDITLYDVFVATEGAVRFAPCAEESGGDEQHCPMQPRCAAHPAWDEASAKVSDVLRGSSLQDLIGASTVSLPG